MPVTLFENARFVAAEQITDAKVLEDGRLLLSGGTRLFVMDPESGKCVMEGSLGKDEGVRLAVHGSSIVTYHPYAGPVRRLELGVRGFGPAHELATVEDEGVVTATFADRDRIVVVEKTKARVVGRDGTLLDEIACPLDGPEHAACAGARVAWQKREAVMCVDVTTKKEVAIAVPGDPTWGEMAISPDGEQLAIAFRHEYVLTIGIFDTGSGAEILRIPLHPTRDNLAMTFSPDGRELFARLDRVLQCWSLADGGPTPRWTRPGVDRASDFLLPMHDRVGVGWGMRLSFVDRTTGEWRGDPLLPKHDIRSILRGEDGVVVMHDGLTARVLEDGRVQRALDEVSSCLRSEGQIFIRRSDALLRAGRRGEEPVAKLVALSERRPGEVRIDADRLVYSGNGDEPVQVADRRGRSVRAVGTAGRTGHTAWPLRGGRIAVHYAKLDLETYTITHSLGVLDRAGETLWERPIHGGDVEILAASGDAVGVRAHASVVVFDVAGEIVTRLEVPELVDATFHGADVLVLAGSGALHRIKGQTASVIADVGPGATAFSVDHRGKCRLRLSCRRRDGYRPRRDRPPALARSAEAAPSSSVRPRDRGLCVRAQPRRQVPRDR